MSLLSGVKSFTKLCKAEPKHKSKNRDYPQAWRVNPEPKARKRSEYRLFTQEAGKGKRDNLDGKVGKQQCEPVHDLCVNSMINPREVSWSSR